MQLRWQQVLESFTGLRIGSATAKGLGLALKKPLIAVPTVDALAYNLYDVSGLICPIMDARRSQVYTGIYRFEEHKLVAVKQQWASPVTELIEELNKLGEPVTFLGDGVPVFRSMIEEKLQVPYSFAPAHVNKQRAAAVGTLGMIYYKEGEQRLPWNMFRISSEFLRQNGTGQKERKQNVKRDIACLREC